MAKPGDPVYAYRFTLRGFMKKITKLALLVVTVSLLPQLAFSAPEDLEAGFKLGKFYVSTQLLAMELEIIQAFSEQFRMPEMTDENYQVDVITDDDIDAASLCLAYTRWRLQYLVIPLCEEGLDGDALDSEYLGDLREQTQLLLENLLVDSNICLGSEGFTAVADLADAIEAAGYIQTLLELAKEAQAMSEGE